MDKIKNSNLLNKIESGINIYSSIIYYTSLIVIIIILLYNIYALYNNSINYNNNNNTNINVNCNIDEIINKEVIGTKSSGSKYNSINKNIYKYKLKISFEVNNKKIIKDYEIDTSEMYNKNDKINLIYNIKLDNFVENSSTNIIINIIIIIICLIILFLYYKYPEEIKSYLLIKQALD